LKLKSGGRPSSTQPSGADTSAAPVVRSTFVDQVYQGSDSEASDEESANPRSAMGQRHLVAQAFANDHVVMEFEEEKRREVEKNAPQKVDMSLPGWGSWVGVGIKRKANPETRFTKRTKGVEPVLRKDFGKKHVIISESKDQKAAKYRLKDLPFPYTNKAQYERSLEVPLGTEWTTRIGHQKAVLPRVTTQMGTVIEPLERLF